MRRSRGRRPACASSTGSEREQPEQHAPERDLHGREAAVADLDQHERHAPDRARAARAAPATRSRAPSRAGALEIEQEALGVEPAAVAGERAVRADHAVARDHDRDRIRAVRGAGRADRRRAPDPRGELGVRDRRAVADALQLLPDALLERRPGRRRPAGRTSCARRRSTPRAGAAPSRTRRRRARRRIAAACARAGRRAGRGPSGARPRPSAAARRRARHRRVRLAHVAPPLSSAFHRCSTV